jgi:hypothetical protein
MQTEEEASSPTMMDPWSLFLYGMKAPMTREKYRGRVAKFFDFVGLTEGKWKSAPRLSRKGAKNNQSGYLSASCALHKLKKKGSQMDGDTPMQQKSYRIVRDCFPNENRRPFCDICIDLLDSTGMTTTCPKAVTEIKSVFRPYNAIYLSVRISYKG